jgi:hypothetical protein
MVYAQTWEVGVTLVSFNVGSWNGEKLTFIEVIGARMKNVAIWKVTLSFQFDNDD